MGPRTIVDKIWDAHRAPDGRPGITVDRIYVHERQLSLLARLGRAGIADAAAAGLVACTDQQLPTRAGVDALDGSVGSAQVLSVLERLETSSELAEVPVFGPGDHRGGVVNVVTPEQGMTWPGSIVAGADRHMSTHGALGAIGLALDDDELRELLRRGWVEAARPRVVGVQVAARVARHAAAKDLALWVLERVGPTFARGAIVVVGGAAVRDLGIDGRMTLCNLLAESGARSVVIEPDDAVVDYLVDRPFAPRGPAWDAAAAAWAELGSDRGADLDGELHVVGPDVTPQVTWGTAAWQAVALDGVVPAPHPTDQRRRAADEEALVAQDLRPGTPMSEVAVDQVFVGSCANGRIDDVRAAADVLRGGRVQVPTWVVPGSRTVARQAEAEGLHQVIQAAGAEWRAAGCSLCIGANGDAVRPGARLASTANRPQKDLVGPGARIHVLGPAAAAASALTGRLTGPRPLR